MTYKIQNEDVEASVKTLKQYEQSKQVPLTPEEIDAISRFLDNKINEDAHSFMPIEHLEKTT